MTSVAPEVGMRDGADGDGRLAGVGRATTGGFV